MADINVTMTVDTTTLQAGDTGDAVAACCNLTDDNGDSSGSQDFEVDGDSGQTVQFSIEPSAQTSFSSFEYEGGTAGTFNPMPSSGNSWTGTIAGTAGQEESYYIYFNVPSIQSTPFKLDPKIKVNT